MGPWGRGRRCRSAGSRPPLCLAHTFLLALFESVAILDMKEAKTDTPTGVTYRIAVVLVPDFSNLTLGAAIEPIRLANRVARIRLYAWKLYTDGLKTVHSSSGLRLTADGDLADATDFHAVFLLVSENAEDHYSDRVARFLREAKRAGKMICAYDSAAIHLARAGLLDGVRATTHREDLEDFEQRFSVSRWCRIVSSSTDALPPPAVLCPPWISPSISSVVSSGWHWALPFPASSCTTTRHRVMSASAWLR